MKKDNSYYFYINGREVKDEDFCSVNPDVKEEYDDNGNIKINLTQYKWKEVDTKPAFYLFCFSNGYSYAGSTKNMLQRLTQHYNQFNDFSCYDWHKKVGDLIRERQRQIGKNKGFKYAFVCCTKIFVQYTSTMEAAIQLERQWLREIKNSEQDYLYYNTIYYSKKAKGYDTKDQIDIYRVVKKAEEIFKGRTVLKVDNLIPIKPAYTKEQEVLITTIKEKVSKMAKNGMVIVTIKDLNFFECYFATKDNAQTLIYSLYFQLVLPNIDSLIDDTDYLPHVKSLRYRNGGPLTIEQIKIEIDGNLSFSWYIKNKKNLPDKVKDLPTQSGIYIITFPTGKKYIGSSNNIQRRVREHLHIIYCWMPAKHISEWNKYAQWYTDVYNELGANRNILDVEIEYRLVDKSEVKEELSKYPIDLLYNREV